MRGCVGALVRVPMYVSVYTCLCYAYEVLLYCSITFANNKETLPYQHGKQLM